MYHIKHQASVFLYIKHPVKVKFENLASADFEKQPGCQQVWSLWLSYLEVLPQRQQKGWRV